MKTRISTETGSISSTRARPRSVSLWATAALLLAASLGATGEQLHRHDTDTSWPMSRIDIVYGRVPTTSSNLLHRWVVAGRDDNGNLRIEGHRFTGNSRENITRDWLASAGGITRVAVAWAGLTSDEDDRFVTAVRDNSGKLRLISWEYGSGVRLDTANYKPSIKNSQIGITSLGGGYMVTAARKNNNDIRLDIWRVTNSGIVQHRGSKIAGNGSWANVVNGKGGRVIAVFRTAGGDLTVQKFVINAGYDRLSRHSGWVSGPASHVKARGYNDHYIMVAFKNSQGNLGVYAYDTDGEVNWFAGNGLAADSTGPVQDVSINHRGKLTTAVVQAGGDLKVIRWNFENAPARMRRMFDNETSGHPLGEATYPAVEGGSGAGGDISTFNQLLTAVRDGGGNLRMTVWHSD